MLRLLRILAFAALVTLVSCGGHSAVRVATTPQRPAVMQAGPRDDVREVAHAVAVRETQFGAAIRYAAALGHNLDVAKFEQAVAAQQRADQLARQRQRAPASHSSGSHTSGTWAATGGGAPCDGDLPPCWRIYGTESGGNWSAYNPGGCSGTGCFGPYQFGGFWAGKLGLPADLRQTTKEQWIAAARQLYNGGKGCSNWNTCGHG